jgi:hypothetical protein
VEPSLDAVGESDDHFRRGVDELTDRLASTWIGERLAGGFDGVLVGRRLVVGISTSDDGRAGWHVDREVSIAVLEVDVRHKVPLSNYTSFDSARRA